MAVFVALARPALVRALLTILLVALTATLPVECNEVAERAGREIAQVN